MQNKYKCRGMMKWAPFASLVGYYDLVDIELKKRYKSKRPILSNDQREDINHSLVFIQNNECNFVLKFYEDGIVKTISTNALKVNSDNLLIRGNKQVMFYDIIDISII